MDVYDHIANAWEERKLREVDGERRLAAVDSALRLLSGALDAADPQSQRDAVRNGLVALREVDTADPGLLERLGMDLHEFDALARDVGLGANGRGLALREAVARGEVKLRDAACMDGDALREHNAGVPLLDAMGIDRDEITL